MLALKEHYEIHYNNGDFGAAFLIAKRMKQLPKEISEIAQKAGKLSAQKRLENGTHNFLGDNNWINKAKNEGKNIDTHFYKTEKGKKVRRQLNQQMYNKGTNRFYDPHDCSKRQKKLVEDGNHNLKGSVTCRNKKGVVIQIPKNIYHSQYSDKNKWEYVSINSKEGRFRKTIFSQN